MRVPVSINDYCQAIGITRKACWENRKKGTIETIKEGSKVYCLIDERLVRRK